MFITIGDALLIKEEDIHAIEVIDKLIKVYTNFVTSTPDGIYCISHSTPQKAYQTFLRAIGDLQVRS